MEAQRRFLFLFLCSSHFNISTKNMLLYAPNVSSILVQVTFSDLIFCLTFFSPCLPGVYSLVHVAWLEDNDQWENCSHHCLPHFHPSSSIETFLWIQLLCFTLFIKNAPCSPIKHPPRSFSHQTSRNPHQCVNIRFKPSPQCNMSGVSCEPQNLPKQTNKKMQWTKFKEMTDDCRFWVLGLSGGYTAILLYNNQPSILSFPLNLI